MARLKAAAPDLPPFGAYRLALAYLKREEDKQPAADLDLILALGPWRSQEHWQAYRNAVEQWRIPEEKDGLAWSLYLDGFFSDVLQPAVAWR